MESYGRKRKHNYHSYNRPSNRSTPRNSLVPGLRGFLCTCNFREKDCIRESLNLLNEYADCDKEETEKDASQLDKPAVEPEEDLDDGDIQDKLNKELESLKTEKNKKPSEKRFQVVDSRAKNCLFIRTTIQEPVQLVHTILKDLEATKVPKTRFLIRLLPIETTCKAFLDDIKESGELLFEKYFSAEGKTFSIVCNYRNNNDIKRIVLIDELAKLIAAKHPDNRVDLKQPELAVLVEIIGNMCCMSVLPDYYKFRKYNLLEVSGCTEGKDPQKSSGGGDGTADPKKDETGTSDGPGDSCTEPLDTDGPGDSCTEPLDTDGTGDSCTEQSEPLNKQAESGDSDEAN